MKTASYRPSPGSRLLALFAAALLSCARTGPPAQEDWETFIASPKHREQYEQFVGFLRSKGVADVVETSELLRQGTDWRKVGAEPFVIPPRELWPNIVPVLRFVEKELKPKLGELEVMSAYRTPAYNKAAGGAKSSRHLHFGALDLQPRTSVVRTELHASLKKLWKEQGPRYAFGLGLYGGTRFHVDTWRHRKWGK